MIDRLWFLQLLHEKEPAKGWDRIARAWYERMERERRASGGDL
jgi:hypothetical protein